MLLIIIPMKQILLKPYPLTLFQNNKLEILAGITFFLIGFQLIFQPFQFRFYPLDDKILVLGAYALICLIVLSVNLWVIPKTFPHWFAKEEWRLWKEIVWISWNIFGISTGIFVFKISFGFYEFTWIRIFHGLLAAMAVGIIPSLLYELLAFTSHSPQSKIPKPQIFSKPITIEAERNQGKLSFSYDELLFITAEKNYLQIFLLKNGNIINHKLRNRIYYAMEKLQDYDEFFRCHRAFIVNLDYVESYSSSAHGGKIKLKNYPALIPISRRFITDFKLTMETRV